MQTIQRTLDDLSAWCAEALMMRAAPGVSRPTEAAPTVLWRLGLSRPVLWRVGWHRSCSAPRYPGWADARVRGTCETTQPVEGCAPGQTAEQKHKKGGTMQPVVAIFTSQEAAEHAAARLGSLGIPRAQMTFLIPGASAAALTEVPTTETEQPGIGTALGSVVGGAVGASGGLMSAAVLSAIIPGIGPVMAIGLGALSLIGAVGGVLAGAAAGGALENAMADGVPKDEICLSSGRAPARADSAHGPYRGWCASGGGADYMRPRRRGEPRCGTRHVVGGTP